LKTYPKLKDITAVIAREEDSTKVRIPWAVLHTPRRASWDIVRLLFIAYHKGNCGDVNTRLVSSASGISPLTLMPLEVIHHIINYLWCDWRIEILNFDSKREFPDLPDTFFSLPGDKNTQKPGSSLISASICLSHSLYLTLSYVSFLRSVKLKVKEGINPQIKRL